MDIGGDLRRARTARHLSLAEISDRTKINRAFLQAIEDNRFDRVPGGLFTRSFLRAYAREVELDPELIVDRYRAGFEMPVEVQTPAESTEGFTVDSIVTPEYGRKRQVAGLALVLLISATYFAFAHRVIPPPPVQGARTTDAVEASSHAERPVATSGRVDVRPETPLEFSIRTTGDCWVVVDLDGERVLARLMRAGERQRFDVREEATLHVGDPATFSYTLDGMPGRALGSARRPATVRFNRQTYKTLTQSGR